MHRSMWGRLHSQDPLTLHPMDCHIASHGQSHCIPWTVTLHPMDCHIASHGLSHCIPWTVTLHLVTRHSQDPVTSHPKIQSHCIQSLGTVKIQSHRTPWTAQSHATYPDCLHCSGQDSHIAPRGQHKATLPTQIACTDPVGIPASTPAGPRRGRRAWSSALEG